MFTFFSVHFSESFSLSSLILSLLVMAVSSLWVVDLWSGATPSISQKSLLCRHHQSTYYSFIVTVQFVCSYVLVRYQRLITSSTCMHAFCVQHSNTLYSNTLYSNTLYSNTLYGNTLYSSLIHLHTVLANRPYMQACTCKHVLYQYICISFAVYWLTVFCVVIAY